MLGLIIDPFTVHGAPLLLIIYVRSRLFWWLYDWAHYTYKYILLNHNQYLNYVQSKEKLKQTKMYWNNKKVTRVTLHFCHDPEQINLVYIIFLYIQKYCCFVDHISDFIASKNLFIYLLILQNSTSQLVCITYLVKVNETKIIPILYAHFDIYVYSSWLQEK
jgi:hypothetical protein